MVDFSNNTLDYIDYEFSLSDISNNTDVSYNNFTTNNLYQPTFDDVQYINLVSEFVGQVFNKITIPVTTIQEALLYKKNGSSIETDISSVYLAPDASGVLILKKTVRVFVEAYFSQEEINTTYIDRDVAWLIDAYSRLDASHDTTNAGKTISDNWKTNSMQSLHRELTKIYRTEINAYLYQSDSCGNLTQDSDGNRIPITGSDSVWIFQLPPSVIGKKSKVTSSINTNNKSVHYSQYKINKSNTKMSCSDFIKEDSKMKLIGEVKDISGITMDNRKNRIIDMITDLLQTDKCRRLILEQIPSVPDAADWTVYPIKAGDILQFGNITVPLPSVDLSNNLYTAETTKDYGFILYNYLEKTLSTYINGLTDSDTSNNCISAGTFINYADPSDNNVSFSDYQLDNLDANTQNKIHLKNKTKITYYSYAVNIVADVSNAQLFNKNLVDAAILKLNAESTTRVGTINISEDDYEELKTAEKVQHTEDVGNKTIGGVEEVDDENAGLYEIAQEKNNDEERHEFNMSMMLQTSMGDLLGTVVTSVLPGSPGAAMQSAFNSSGIGEFAKVDDATMDDGFDLLKRLEAAAQIMYVGSAMWRVLGYIVKNFKIDVNNGILLLNNLHTILGKVVLDIIVGIWEIYKGLLISMFNIAESMIEIIYPTLNNLKGLLESVIDLIYGTTNGYVTKIAELLKTFTINLMHILLDVFIDENDTTNYSGISGSTPTKTNGDYITSARIRFDYLTDEMFLTNFDNEIKNLYYSTASATAKPKAGDQFTDTRDLHGYNLIMEVGLYFMLQIYMLQTMIGIMKTTMNYVFNGSYDMDDLNLGDVLINVLRFVTSFPDIEEIAYAFEALTSTTTELTSTDYSGNDLDTLKTLLTNVCTVGSNFLYFLFTLINPSTSLYDTYAKAFQDVVKGINTVIEVVGEAVEAIVTGIVDIFNSALDIADEAWNSIAGALGIDVAAVEELVSAIAEAIVGAISDAIGAIGDGLKAIADGIKDVGKAAVALANEAYDALNDTFGKDSALYKGAVEVFDNVKEELAKIGEDLIEVGKKLLKIAEDIKKKVEEVLRAVSKALDAIADWFSNAWESWKCFWYPNDCRIERANKIAYQNGRRSSANYLRITLDANKVTAEATKSSLQSQKTAKTTELNTKQTAKETAKQVKDASEAVKIQGKTDADNKAKQAKINDTVAASKTSLSKSLQEVLPIRFKMKLRNIKTASNDTTFAYKPIDQFNIVNGIYNNVYVYEISGNTYATTTDDNAGSYNYLRDNFVLAVKNKTPAYPVNTMFYKLIMASIDIPERTTKIQSIGTLEKNRVEERVNFQSNSYFYNSVKQSTGLWIISKKHYKYKVPLFTVAYPNNTTVNADNDYFYIDKTNWTQLKTAVNTEIYRSVYAFNKG